MTQETTDTITAEEAAALRERIQDLERKQPKFVRNRPEGNLRARTYVPPEALRRQSMKNLAKGQNDGGTTRWLDTPQGRDSLPPEYRPVFQPGNIVRLNPDAVIFGSDGKTWGDLLEARSLDGVGEVVGTMYITDTWEPKYKVSIRGLTNGSGDGFRESELLPYE